jgi:hypothetical protein
MMVRLLYDYFRVLISVIAFVNKAVSGHKILHIAPEPASSGRQDHQGVPMQSSGRPFLDGTDADLQRGLTPRPGALNIWHGESGETLISGDAEMKPPRTGSPPVAACRGPTKKNPTGWACGVNPS